MGGWQRARIIPVSGIGSEKEAEQRATSALLAVLSIVRPFSKAVLGPLGASKADKASVNTYIEPTFKDANGKAVRPDGLIEVAYGAKDPFVVLVEVKTGQSKLTADQINAYWEIARREKYDAVLTISNEIAPSIGVHPTPGLKVRSNSAVAVHHLSWTRLLTMAVMEKSHRGVEDPEQDWILGELIRYLEHDSSGALGFDDMGPNWTDVRDGAREGTLTARQEGVEDIVLRWDQLLGYLSLQLGADIGRDVTEVLTRAEMNDPKVRPKRFGDEIRQTGTLSGTLRVPDTVGDIQVVVDLKARQNIVSVDVTAPSDKGGRGRVTWLTKQLSDAPEGLVVEAFAKNSQTPLVAPLAVVREDSTVLLRDDKKDPYRFRIVARSELGLNRRSGKTPGFVQSVSRAVESFYGSVLQGLRAYQPRAPQLRSVAPPEPEPELPTVPLISTFNPPPPGEAWAWPRRD